MFRLPRLAISLVVLVGLLVAADYGLRLYSENVVAGEVQSSLELSKKPSVGLGGFPFALHLFSGEVPSATFEADSFNARGVALRRVHLELSDLSFPSGRLLSGGGGVVHARSGRGTAAMTGAEITAALRGRGVPLDVEIEGGKATVSAGGIHAGLDLAVEDGKLVLTPSAAALVSARIPLPQIVHGLRYTGVKLEGFEAVLSFRLRNATFMIP